MAQTTTAVNSCAAEVWLDNSAGVSTDISGSSTSVTLSPDIDIGEFQTFESRWRGRLACAKDLPISIDLVYTTTAAEAWDILKEWFFTSHGAARTVTIYMPDKNVGSDVIQGEYLLDDMPYTIDATDPAPVMVTMNLLPDGEVTHTVATT